MKLKALAKILIVIVLTSLVFTSCAPSAVPHIGENGNWWIGEEDTGVSARGPKGEKGDTGDAGQDGINGENGEDGESGTTPHIGKNGNWWIGNTDTGVKAGGVDGESVTVTSVKKTSSKGNVDTYTIYFSDSTTATFTVTNGIDGAPGEDGEDGEDGQNGECVYITSVEKISSESNIDTYLITFSDAGTYTFTVTNGNDGESITIQSIEKESTDGAKDTYKITFSDNTSLEFTVQNAITPHIGENGNWWIGEEDTGILADFSADDREISDGLHFEAMTAGGVAGMVVTDYDGTDTDVVIPNYVGAVPVIGISASAFRDDTKITSISLSKNTVRLADYVFEGCTALSSIDFNGAPLKNIPSYAFQNTAITSIDLPESVTTLSPYCFYQAKMLKEVDFNGAKVAEIPNYAFYDTKLVDVTLPDTVLMLGNYAFGNIRSINYDNVTYFGDYALAGYAGGYVYLGEHVEHVGSYAFASSYVYTEHKEIPSTWGSNIVGTSNLNKYVITGANSADDYIYVINEDLTATVHRYTADSKRITVPAYINGSKVTKIGYGFGSVTEEQIEILAELSLVNESIPQTLDNIPCLDEVKIPSTVTKIDYSTFVSIGTMIFIPSSVNTMWCINDDDGASNYYAFESSTYPTFKVGFVDSSESKASIGSYVRHGVSITRANAMYDPHNELYYYADGNGYSLLAYMDIAADTLTIPGKYNEKTVHTIRSGAIEGLPMLKSVKISSGVTKIQSYAFDNLSLLSVIIPTSVTTVNAYAFNNVCSTFYAAASAKPSEWDSYWAGSSTSSHSVVYGVNADTLSVDGDFLYYTSNGTATLVKYLGTTNYILIPKTLGGCTVTTVKQGFFNGNYATVIIPSTVTRIEYRAFVSNSSSKTTFYCVAAEKPELWDSAWNYNSYSSSYTTVNWNYTILENAAVSGDFIYTEEGDTITLLTYLGSSRSVYIPREIAGKTVTKINTNFLTSSSYVYVYVPKTVTVAGSNAFNVTGTSSYSEFYFEGANLPSEWDSCYYYNSYYGSYSRLYTYFNQTLPY